MTDANGPWHADTPLGETAAFNSSQYESLKEA